MPKQKPNTQRLSQKALAEKEARHGRQAQALRENLKKRKAQVRERTDGEGRTPPSSGLSTPTPGPSPGPTPGPPPGPAGNPDAKT